MITIIHGEDIESSRIYLQEEKQKHKDYVSYEGKKITSTDLSQNLQGFLLSRRLVLVCMDRLRSRTRTIGSTGPRNPHDGEKVRISTQ